MPRARPEVRLPAAYAHRLFLFEQLNPNSRHSQVPSSSDYISVNAIPSCSPVLRLRRLQPRLLCHLPQREDSHGHIAH